MNYAMTHSDRIVMPKATDSSCKAAMVMQRKLSSESNDLTVANEDNHEQTKKSRPSHSPTEEKPKALSSDRLRVRAMLEARMRKCQVNDNARKLQLQAAALENALYCHLLRGHPQKHRGPAHDEASLNQQLSLLMRKLVLQRRRRAAAQQQRKKSASSSSSSAAAVVAPRCKALQECLGVRRYARLQSILEQIQHLGMTRGCCHSSCGGATPLQGHTQAPHPIRQLFFQTQLLSVVHRTPVDELAGIDNWDDLLEQAEAHIRDYHEWSRQYDGSESCCLLVHQLCDATTGAPRANLPKGLVDCDNEDAAVPPPDNRDDHSDEGCF